MRLTRCLRAALPALAVVAAWAAIAGTPVARAEGVFSARLIWVPISGAERDGVAGHGLATGTLSGSRLVIEGSFEGLPAPVTAARLHHGVAKAARGPVIAELEVNGAESGSLSGEVELSAEQVEALAAGQLYVQVHSERGVAPDNSNLWGWLLP